MNLTATFRSSLVSRPSQTSPMPPLSRGSSSSSYRSLITVRPDTASPRSPGSRSIVCGDAGPGPKRAVGQPGETQPDQLLRQRRGVARLVLEHNKPPERLAEIPLSVQRQPRDRRPSLVGAHL